MPLWGARGLSSGTSIVVEGRLLSPTTVCLFALTPMCVGPGTTNFCKLPNISGNEMTVPHEREVRLRKCAKGVNILQN